MASVEEVPKLTNNPNDTYILLNASHAFDACIPLAVQHMSNAKYDPVLDVSEEILRSDLFSLLLLLFSSVYVIVRRCVKYIEVPFPLVANF